MQLHWIQPTFRSRRRRRVAVRFAGGVGGWKALLACRETGPRFGRRRRHCMRKRGRRRPARS